MPELLKRASFRIPLLLTLTAAAVFPQGAGLGKSCNLAAAGIGDAKGFLDFDRELRTALSKQDALTMALLVTYPLRIDEDRGTYSLDDPAAIQSHFQDVFPPSVRSAVIDQKPEGFFCNAEGVMYGNGEVWVVPTAVGYAIKVINLPVTGPAPASKIEFACNAEKHRIVIDAPSNGTVRYRAWDRPRPLTDKPDMEIPDGKQGSEGTGPCRYPVWTFTRGVTQYTVSGIGGCSPSPSQPPGARGTLEVTAAGKSLARSWCY
jgi:hypothetical protein